jgi:hypothetical protein
MGFSAIMPIAGVSGHSNSPGDHGALLLKFRKKSY